MKTKYFLQIFKIKVNPDKTFALIHHKNNSFSDIQLILCKNFKSFFKNYLVSDEKNLSGGQTNCIGNH